MRTKLSVNINKVATIRNARGGNNPDLLKVAKDCELFGADGITVHPRPDERHIRRADVPALQAILRTEFNIEGYPSKEFMELVLRVRPSQVTLVPDKPDQLTSNSGWDTEKEQEFLRDILNDLRTAGIRSSLFIDADIRMAEFAAKAGTRVARIMHRVRTVDRTALRPVTRVMLVIRFPPVFEECVLPMVRL